LDESHNQIAAHPVSTKLRPDIQPLHLANSRLQFAQGHTTCRHQIAQRKKQLSFRRTIFTRQSCQLCVEALKTKTRFEEGAIFSKERPNLTDLLMLFRRHDRKLLSHFLSQQALM